MKKIERTGVPKNESVCIITEARAFGGVEVHTLGLMKLLIDRGYRIDMISCRHHFYDERIRTNGWQDKVTITHTDLGVGISDSWRNASRRWKELLQTIHGDILIFPKGNNSMGGIRFLRSCRRSFRKVFFIEHLEDPLPARTSKQLFGIIPAGIGLWWYKQRFFKKVCPFYADRIIAVSEKVKERLTQDWGNAPDKVVVSHNGIPWQHFTRNEERGMAFRSHHGIPSDAFIFGMIARLREEKGIDIALRALYQLFQKGSAKTVYLVIAGEGPDEEGLKNLTKELDLEKHVRFLGFVHDVREVLSSYDVILFSSRLEGLPLGLLEGMAAGCIPIVTRISGMPEVVNAPEIGWVVSPENPAELCDAMQSVLNLDRATISQMRQKALRRIQEHFDIVECHRKILEVCGL